MNGSFCSINLFKNLWNKYFNPPPPRSLVSSFERGCLPVQYYNIPQPLISVSSNIIGIRIRRGADGAVSRLGPCAPMGVYKLVLAVRYEFRLALSSTMVPEEKIMRKLNAFVPYKGPPMLKIS